MRRIFYSLIVVFFLFIFSTARATTVIKLELPEVVALAEHIIEGKVTDVLSFKDEKGMICTRVTLQVSQYLSGTGTKEYSFVIPGGKVGDQGLLISGLPQFNVGEEAILFLTPEGTRGIRVPVGYAQGKYRIATDAKSGQKLVTQESFDGLNFISSQTGAAVEAKPALSRDYTKFVDEIRRLAANKERAK